MYSDGPKRVKPGELILQRACPASALPRRTKKPDNALTRWKAVMEAITQWYADGTPEDVDGIEAALFGVLDPVQRDLCAKAFRSWRSAIGTGGVASFDPPWPSVTSADGAHYMSAAIQVELEQDDGSTEHIKIKSRTPTSEEERAIISLGAEPDVDYLEVLLEPGQVDSLTMEPDEAQEVADRLFALAAEERDKRVHAGGFHCWRCDRVSLCDQYPSLTDGPPPSGTKSVVLGKGTLSHLSECPRRVAWKALFQLPTEVDDLDGDIPGPALTMGNLLHDALAVALLDDDPDGVMRTHAGSLPPSEQAEFLSLWETHSELAASSPHAVEVSRTELAIGCTAPAPTGDGMHAITFLGVVDAAGREDDGTPAIIEHRTTARRELPHLEQELYAVAGAMAVRAPRIAVHHHWLRAHHEEACTRRVFEPDDLERARDLLIDAAIEIANWDREDALDAPFVLGEWCRFCPYEGLCRQYRA